MTGEDLIHAGRSISGAGGLTIGLAIGTPCAMAIGAIVANARWAVNGVNSALILMLLVVAIAALGGRLAGTITAIAAAVSFDFFHTEPFLSLAITSRDDIETTLLLLIAGLLAGAIATTGRLARHRQLHAESGVQRIHRVAEAAATGQPAGFVLAQAQAEIKDLLDLSDCWFEDTTDPDAAPRPLLGRNGAIVHQTFFQFRRRRNGRRGFELPSQGVDLPVLARGRHIGHLVLVPSPRRTSSVQDRMATVAIADQVGAAWDAASSHGPAQDM
jgi:K+-sensing histidine kinase KdpD